MPFDHDKYIFQEPEEEWSVDSNYIEITLEYENVYVEDGGGWIADTSVFTDYFDPDTHALVLDAMDLEDIFWDTLSPEIPDVDGNYLLSGWVRIPYEIYTRDFPERDKNERYEDEPNEVEVELVGDPSFGNLKWEYIEEDDVLEEI